MLQNYEEVWRYHFAEAERSQNITSFKIDEKFGDYVFSKIKIEGKVQDLISSAPGDLETHFQNYAE